MTALKTRQLSSHGQPQPQPPTVTCPLQYKMPVTIKYPLQLNINFKPFAPYLPPEKHLSAGDISEDPAESRLTGFSKSDHLYCIGPL